MKAASPCTSLGILLAFKANSETLAFTSTKVFRKQTFLSPNHGGRYVTTDADAFPQLNAKKKGGKQIVSDVDFLDLLDDDEPLSKKDQIKAQKAAEKAAKKKSKESSVETTTTTTMSVRDNGTSKVDPKAAAAEALKKLNFDDDEPMSAKEKAELEKKLAKEAKKKAKESQAQTTNEVTVGKKDKKAAALKALEEMERMEAQMAAEAQDQELDVNGDPVAKMSKKELKEARKKAEKEAEKKAAKEAKKAAKKLASEDGNDDVETDGAEVSTNDMVGVVTKGIDMDVSLVVLACFL
jgi:hypothetical protein